ncbi:eukaryotic translation initiation factor 4E1-like isoform X1 [Pectinophora gossypiella]|uniref:eIF-4F 25 kDa subunit n=1 Tax=Pectinophora gossypiella TaxID=13191 RepID=A0A1E1W208_PECGO|nr:eukaryotic translation initiation factor 4E1-like isoform X1 [Pectinophora gossypiella]
MSQQKVEGPKVMEQKTPVEVPIEDMKHPLEHAWSFWMFTNDKKKWEDNLVELTTFDTVEDYWCLYHYMKSPSELTMGQDYMIFKKGIQPMWEDAANRRGGRWLISLEKRKGEMDRMWLDVVLLMIGENFEHNDDVCGVVVNIRGKCKIAVWTADASNHKAYMEIGRKIKDALGPYAKLSYQHHNSSKNIHTM